MNMLDLPEELMHWSPEAEAGVIGGLLVAGAEAYDAVGDVLKSDSFAVGLFASAYAAIESQVLAGKTVDLVSVYEALRGVDEDAAQTLVELNRCTSAYVGMRVLRQHAEIVAEKAASRSLQRAAGEIKGIAADETMTVEDRIATAQTTLEKVSQPAAKSEPKCVDTFVTGFIDRLQDIADGKVQPGIPTQIPTLDHMLGGGLKGGKQIIVAARPSVGKSSLAQQLCLNVAQQGHAAAMFSMEMGCAELTDRTVANLGRIRLDAIGNGKLDEGEWGRVSEAIESMRALPLFFDEQPALSLGDIVSRARSLKRKHNLKLLAIDYLQLCSSGKASESRHHQIEEISRGLKALAKQLDISIVTLSQLNREVEKRTGGRPVLSDLKESGAIEEDADVVLMLWRHKVGQFANTIGCAVPKNRQGRVGEFALHFEGPHQRWTESTESLAPLTKQMGRTNSYTEEV
ncbi:DnaB-like helicase C-terminal domain-containing protein [Acidovorax sp. Leaf73]|uniref:replicative DNA helicase n=1 Tax=Acidovorax sp. Leaf73 TaxID=2876566 RepID=UPI001E5A2225|nr:DnaB-like helicase C-terminal domain-containing protein [Acidovorax sp. Leaf73]